LVHAAFCDVPSGAFQSKLDTTLPRRLVLRQRLASVFEIEDELVEDPNGFAFIQLQGASKPQIDELTYLADRFRLWLWLATPLVNAGCLERMP